MTLPRLRRPVLVLAAALAALGPASIRAQDASVAGSIVKELQQACIDKVELRGARVVSGVIKEGVLQLSGTLDSREQGKTLEAEVRRLLETTPAWKTEVTGGAATAGMGVVAVRTDFLPKLRASLAGSEKPLLRQTRLDDLYFDASGTLHAQALCVNQTAFNQAKTNKSRPRGDLELEVTTLLKRLPLPEGFAASLACEIEFKENPARVLQTLAGAEATPLDEMLFQNAEFDDLGALHLTGMLGTEAERAQAEALAGRPAIVEAYKRPITSPELEPKAIVAGMVVAPWRAKLLQRVQEAFARPINRTTLARAQLRYCRADRARFVYPETSGLTLQCDVLAVIDTDGKDLIGQAESALHDECAAVLPRLQAGEYGVSAVLTRKPNPRSELQRAVAATPALDGVRVDDVTFGAKGEPTVEGVWTGQTQLEPLSAVAEPVLARVSNNLVKGPIAAALTVLPTDRLLRTLRGKIAASFNDTSLDRLFFQGPAADSAAAPAASEAEQVKRYAAAVRAELDVTTTKTLAPKVQEQLARWLEENKLAGLDLAAPTLVTLDASILSALRTKVASDQALDGLRIDRATFDEENALVITGLQDREGQAQAFAPLARTVATQAWPTHPFQADVHVGSFTIWPLQPVLKALADKLPQYPEADGVILNRVSYGADGSLMFGGRTSGASGDRPELRALIKKVLGADARLEVKFHPLAIQHRDPDKTNHLLAHLVDVLDNGNAAGLSLNDLNEAIFLDPANSTAWYLRAACYYSQDEKNLAVRDLMRVKSLEALSPSRTTERLEWLKRFKDPLRTTLDDLESHLGSPG